MSDNLPLIYVAHPFGGDGLLLPCAEAWVAYLCRNFPALFWAPWIPICRHWPDSGESRKRGLELDLAAVRRSDGLILVGGEVSPGMRVERDAARSIWDWSEYRTPEDFEELDYASKSSAVVELLDWIESLTPGIGGAK